MIAPQAQHTFAGAMVAPVLPGAQGGAPGHPPIDYDGVRMVVASLPAPLEALGQLLPHGLRPRRLYGRFGCLAIQFVSMPKTSIGPYEEAVVSIVCQDEFSWPQQTEPVDWRPSPCLPLWLSVTTPTARDSGQRYWGYPKVMAPTRLDVTPKGVVGSVATVAGLDIRLAAPAPGPFDDGAIEIRSLTQMADGLWKTSLGGKARIAETNDVPVELYWGRRTAISRRLAELEIVPHAVSVMHVEDFSYALEAPFGRVEAP